MKPDTTELTRSEFWITPIRQRENAEEIIRTASNSLLILVSITLVVGVFFACARGLALTPKVITQIILLLILLAICLFLKKRKSIIAALLLIVCPCGLGLGVGLVFMIMGISDIHSEGGQVAAVVGALLSLFWLPFTWAMLRAFIATIKLKWKLKETP